MYAYAKKNFAGQVSLVGFEENAGKQPQKRQK
jgi:hypothetical protein